nr:hypothetical protein [Acholeplasmatales bacterium]
ATSEATSTEEVVVNHVEAKDATCEEDGTISETIIANMRRDGVEVSSVDANLEYEILLRGVTAEVGMIIYQ